MIHTLIVLIALINPLAFGAPNSQSETKVAESDTHQASVGFDLQWAPIHYTNYSFAPGAPTARSGNAVMMGIEWLPIQRFGKLGLGVGAGFFVQANQEVGSDQRATLNAIPLDAHLSYHFDYSENQLIVPFASVGPSLTFLRQTSSTGAAIVGTQKYAGWEYSFGGQLCLNRIDPMSSRSFRMLTDVERSYIVFSFNRSQPLYADQSPDLSYSVVRLGFRLEI